MKAYESIYVVSNTGDSITEALYYKHEETYDFIIPTDGSVLLMSFYCDTPITDFEMGIEIMEGDIHIAIATSAGKDVISFDLDGNVISNNSGAAIELEYCYHISSDEELDELVDDDCIDESVYDALEELSIILA